MVGPQAPPFRFPGFERLRLKTGPRLSSVGGFGPPPNRKSVGWLGSPGSTTMKKSSLRHEKKKARKGEESAPACQPNGGE